MGNPSNVLTIVENHVEWTESTFRWFRRREEVKRKAPVHEFYIDGAPLLSLIEPAEADDPDRKMPLLGRDRPDESLDQLQQLLGGPLPADRNGRVWVLYCQCGDPGCGGFSTRITFTETTVAWADFGWDDVFGSPTEAVEIDKTFVFERAAYERLMHDLIRRLTNHHS
ncbi:hypothetical protein [Arthrobacter silvisoli]|uniref:hypothetical protein n=1 Tax=Arthrobacter silvisoli TaxID=2291022 RepID=UPI000E20D9B4|nr:hypothetical protein [Arthrobacter silvisoli]